MMIPDDMPEDVSVKPAHMTVVAMRGESNPVFAFNIGDKRELLATLTDEPLFVVWTGQYHSKMFRLSREQFARDMA
jgi:hypothetical protein